MYYDKSFAQNATFHASIESRRKVLTGECGICRRMNEKQYKQVKIAAPARELFSSFWLSFIGMKTVLSVLVSSKRRWDTCESKSKNINIKQIMRFISTVDSGKGRVK